MADELDDDVFIVENGMDNHDVPLILPHNLQHDELEGILEAEPNNQIVPAHGNNPVQIAENLLQGVFQQLNINQHAPVNGIMPQAVLPPPQVVQAPLIHFDQNEVLDASTPNLEHRNVVGNGNEGFQTDSSELSEFTASNETQPEVSSANGMGASSSAGNSHEMPSGAFSGYAQSSATNLDVMDKRLPPNPPNSPASVKSGSRDSRKLLAATPFSLESCELLPPNPPNPPNSPASVKSAIQESKRLLAATPYNLDSCEVFHPNVSNSSSRDQSTLSETSKDLEASTSVVQILYEPGPSHQSSGRDNGQATPQTPPVSGPDKLFIKFGCFMVLLILLCPMALIACIQEIIPYNYITLFIILWIFSFFGSLYFFRKACQMDESPTPTRRTEGRVTYGSTENANPDEPDAE